ncbi:4-(cytidine 5'-diphospho)-2-C-methyl-D-erythritol kinase [Dehalogenimonas sp. THU2]|uniref:4-(cytidine 5'-diphospho)-2-C-methyl-D-erythritol kinase n=1 Tax=Dehalogenimonas sp. THU2 TaxID=3151121 RepID=UPI0032186F04
MFKLTAPAKINLALEVLGKRPDGYHEIKSVVQAIDLADELEFELAGDLDITADLPGWEAKKSLVSRAAQLLKPYCRGVCGASIRVKKRIPLISGLGGDSSDGAAALKGLNRLWGLGLGEGSLMEMSAALGSDVPFFFCGGTALIEGRGELVSPLGALPQTWVVLLIPPVTAESGKTARLYGSLKPNDFSDGSRTEELAETLIAGRPAEPSLLGNAFEQATGALWPKIEEYRWRFLMAGAPRVHLSGAGPALFSLHRDRAAAEKIYRKLKEDKLATYLARTIGYAG